jgi:hypothetical protein
MGAFWWGEHEGEKGKLEREEERREFWFLFLRVFEKFWYRQGGLWRVFAAFLLILRYPTRPKWLLYEQ